MTQQTPSFQAFDEEEDIRSQMKKGRAKKQQQLVSSEKQKEKKTFFLSFRPMKASHVESSSRSLSSQPQQSSLLRDSDGRTSQS